MATGLPASLAIAGWCVAAATVAGQVDAPSAGACALAQPASVGVLSTLGLVGDGVPGRVLEGAVELWRGCANFGSGFPEVVVGPGDRTLDVRLERRPGPGRCGSFAGNRVTLYRTQREAGGRLVGCGDLAANLAHEVGHALGLGDVPTLGRCARHIMAHISPVNVMRRRVRTDECMVAGQLWLTRAELAAAQLTGVGGGPAMELRGYVATGAR